MKTVCSENQCTGCMACVVYCPRNAISIVDSMKQLNATIDEGLCVNCKKCYDVCQVNHPLPLNETIQWHQGWANNKEVRAKGSSGSVATAIEKSFIEAGGYVVTCVCRNGAYIYDEVSSLNDLYQFSGSKYVKSNPANAYRKAEELLKQDERVLFVGLPCHVGGLKKYLKNCDVSNLLTIDIICHGSPSPLVLDKYLEQYNTVVNDTVSFRNKQRFGLRIANIEPEGKGTVDCYSLAFLSGLSYTENCYSCQYAQQKRVADITLGDSWGNALSSETNKGGVSLILIQTSKGQELVEKADLRLLPVDYRIAVRHNKQLNEPSHIPQQRNDFFSKLQEGVKFNNIIKSIS